MGALVHTREYTGVTASEDRVPAAKRLLIVIPLSSLTDCGWHGCRNVLFDFKCRMFKR